MGLCVSASVTPCVTFVSTGRTLTKIKNVKNHVLQILTFAIEWRHCKIIFRDLDLLFASQKFEKFYMSKTVGASAKMHKTTFQIWIFANE